MKKKAKLKIVFKDQPELVQMIDYEEFEKIIKHHYKINYNFKQSFKRKSNTEYIFYISKNIFDEETVKYFDDFKSERTETMDPYLILVDLCNSRLIEEGYYLIRVED